MGAGAVGGATARPTRQMGRRAQRGVRQLRARPRQSHTGAPGARPRRWVSRPRCRHGGQSRRLSVHQRPRQFDQFAGQRHGRGLRHPGRVHGGARRLHKHAADRCLSRRRQARSQLPDRAACGSRRAPAGNRSRGVAPAQPDHPLPVSQRSRGDDRLRTFRRQSRRDGAAGPDRRLCRAAPGRGRAR